MTYWQNRISRPDAPAVPIYVRRMRRTFWSPPRYETLVRYLATHPTFTQREAAAETGYTLSGLRHALERLRSWGVLASVSALRGRLGRTIAKLQSDVRLLNVSTAGRVYLRPSLRISSSVTAVETFTAEPAPEIWRALRETLFGRRLAASR